MIRCALMSVSLFSAVWAQAVTIESHGSFDIYYYGAGEVWNGITNEQAWSATQQEDVCSAIDERWARTGAPSPILLLHYFNSAIKSRMRGKIH